MSHLFLLTWKRAISAMLCTSHGVKLLDTSKEGYRFLTSSHKARIWLATNPFMDSTAPCDWCCLGGDSRTEVRQGGSAMAAKNVLPQCPGTPP